MSKQIRTIKFPEIFSIGSGNTQVNTGISSINDCLYLLLTTSKGELFGDPNYGTNLMKEVFNYNNSTNNELIKADIASAIARYERRIRAPEDSIMILNYENYVFIRVSFTLVESNEQSVFDLTLLKGGDYSGY